MEYAKEKPNDPSMKNLQTLMKNSRENLKKDMLGRKIPKPNGTKEKLEF